MRRPLPCLVVGLGVLMLIGWGAGALWVSIGAPGDLAAVREIAAQQSLSLTSAMRALTWVGSAFVLIPLALICCLAFVIVGRRRETVAVALSLGGAILIANAVKLLVSRPRPPVEHLQVVTGQSFPSAHATQAGAFWLSLVLAARSARYIRLVAATSALLVAMVALSRVYLGVHYPSDVIAGVLLGSGWAVLVARCIELEPIRWGCRAQVTR